MLNVRTDPLLLSLGCSLMVLASFAPSPQELMDVVGFGSSTTINVIGLFLALSPIYPLLLILIGLMARFSYSQKKLRKVSAIIFVTGSILTLIIAGLSGPGFYIVMINGISISIAISLSLIMFSSKPSVGVIPILGGLIVLVASAWSLVSAGSALYQAKEIAKTRPYCIAHHSRHSADQRALALPDLRGSKLFTTNTGYKGNSRWYFHAVLIVKEAQGNIFYNWSPRHMKFDVVRNEKLLLVPVRYSCIPTNEFI